MRDNAIALIITKNVFNFSVLLKLRKSHNNILHGNEPQRLETVLFKPVKKQIFNSTASL